MQSCPKNVHTGPLTGDSKGPGPQESLFVLPTAAAAALPGETGGPLAPGHPPSPARGSSGGPAAAQGPSPTVEEEQSTPPAWVAAEPTPPPSDDSSAPRSSFFFLDQVDNNNTDVNQNYNRKRKHASGCTTSTTPYGTKKVKTTDDHLNNNNCTSVPPNLNEPLLITTTMLADASKVGQFDNLSVKLHSKGGGAPQMGILPLTPPNSSDTSPSISSTGSSAGKTKPAKARANKAEEEKLKKVQRKLSALSPQEKPSKKEAKFELISRSLDSPEIDNSTSAALSTPKASKKLKCPEPSTPAPEVSKEQKSLPVEEPVKCEIGKKVRKKSGQNVTPPLKKSKKLSPATLAAEVEEMAHNEMIVSLRKSFVPKWSNGWSWEGEPYQAKVFLRVSLT